MCPRHLGKRQDLTMMFEDTSTTILQHSGPGCINPMHHNRQKDFRVVRHIVRHRSRRGLIGPTGLNESLRNSDNCRERNPSVSRIPGFCYPLCQSAYNWCTISSPLRTSNFDRVTCCWSIPNAQYCWGSLEEVCIQPDFLEHRDQGFRQDILDTGFKESLYRTYLRFAVMISLLHF